VAGVTGATGKGATGPTGSEGPSGGEPPATLPSGKTERGFWVATAPSFPEVGRLNTAVISFPIPLAKASTKVNYLTNAQTKAGTTECPKTEALEKPQAAKGVMCVYTGQENLTNAAFKSITNASGVSGDSLTGASVAFEATGVEAANNIVVQGTWAVTAE
jgi:hypothetical protein